MTIVENYLTQVAEYLASDNDTDVLQELESAIYDAIEEREAEQGRPLANAELARILRKFGAPIDVAAKYARQQYLVGPTLFPVFRHSLKVMLGIVVILQCLNTLLRLASGEVSYLSITALLQVIFTSSVWGFAALVVIFAVVEKYQIPSPLVTSSWDPLKMTAMRQSKGDRKDAATTVISDTVMLILWNLWVGPASTAGATIGQFTMVLPNVYSLLFWPINGLLLISLLLNAWQLLSNSWNKVSIGAAIALDSSALVVVAMLLASTDQLLISSDNIEQLQPIANHAKNVLQISLAVVFGFIAWDLKNHCKMWKKVSE